MTLLHVSLDSVFTKPGTHNLVARYKKMTNIAKTNVTVTPNLLLTSKKKSL